MTPEPQEIRARTMALQGLDTIQTRLYLDYSGVIADQVYDAIQAEIDIAIQAIKAVKV